MSDSGEVRGTVKADPDRLWALVTDITRIGQWSPETNGAEWLDAPLVRPSAPGSRATTGGKDRSTSMG